MVTETGSKKINITKKKLRQKAKTNQETNGLSLCPFTQTHTSVPPFISTHKVKDQSHTNTLISISWVSHEQAFLSHTFTKRADEDRYIPNLLWLQAVRTGFLQHMAPPSRRSNMWFFSLPSFTFLSSFLQGQSSSRPFYNLHNQGLTAKSGGVQSWKSVLENESIYVLIVRPIRLVM